MPDPAGRALVYASDFRQKSLYGGVEETSSRPRRPARGAQRTPSASQVRGGPGSTTAAPVAPAVREILGGRRAGLPGSRPAPDEQPSPRGVTRKRAPKPVRAYPEALPPKSEGGCPEALPPRWEADCPKPPFRPSPREATRKPGGGSQAEAARRRRAQPAQGRGGLPGNRPAPDEQPTNPTIPPISHPRAAVI